MTILCTEIKRFSERRQGKINGNEHKDYVNRSCDKSDRGWKYCDPMLLLSRLKEETQELEDALNSDRAATDAPNECADVANFAMMISDILTSLP